jgi:nucleoside-diphosphate-sugar epimerase
MDIRRTRLMLIGGAGLIGSYIADRLVKEPVAEVVIFDNFVRGIWGNLSDAERGPSIFPSVADSGGCRRRPEQISNLLLTTVRRFAFNH